VSEDGEGYGRIAEVAVSCFFPQAIWCLTARDWQEASGIALRSLEQW
jgi:hypothetical protein